MNWQEIITIAIAACCGLWVLKRMIGPFTRRPSPTDSNTLSKDQELLSISDPDP